MKRMMVTVTTMASRCKTSTSICIHDNNRVCLCLLYSLRVPSNHSSVFDLYHLCLAIGSLLSSIFCVVCLAFSACVDGIVTSTTPTSKHNKHLKTNHHIFSFSYHVYNFSFTTLIRR